MGKGRTALFVLKILSAAGAAALTVGLALISAKQWEPSDGVVLGLALAAAGLAFVAASSAAWADYRGRQRKILDQHVASNIKTAFWNISKDTEPVINGRDLGISVYRVARDRPRRSGIELYWKRERLRRLHRERPRNHNETTGLIWRPGKGVVGTCVKQSAVAYSDVGQDWAPYLRATAEEWQQASAEVRQGLSYAEFRSLVTANKRLGVVVASPILKDGIAVGCVAVDGPTGTESYDLLTSQEVKDHLSDAATAIGMFL